LYSGMIRWWGWVDGRVGEKTGRRRGEMAGE
jgi:hypothetical protein